MFHAGLLPAFGTYDHQVGGVDPGLLLGDARLNAFGRIGAGVDSFRARAERDYKIPRGLKPAEGGCGDLQAADISGS